MSCSCITDTRGELQTRPLPAHLSAALALAPARPLLADTLRHAPDGSAQCLFARSARAPAQQLGRVAAVADADVSVAGRAQRGRVALLRPACERGGPAGADGRADRGGGDGRGRRVHEDPQAPPLRGEPLGQRHRQVQGDGALALEPRCVLRSPPSGQSHADARTNRCAPWTDAETARVLERLREAPILPKGLEYFPAVHVIELHPEGYIGAHVDSIKVSRRLHPCASPSNGRALMRSVSVLWTRRGGREPAVA